MRMDPNYNATLTQAIGLSSANEQRLTTELGTGLRVSSISVDPAAAESNVQLSSAISRIDAFVQSSASQQSRLQVTDSTLGDVVTQVTSALSLAVQGGNGTLPQTALNALAAQVTEIRNNVVATANTSYAGVYLFGGSQGRHAAVHAGYDDKSGDGDVPRRYGDADHSDAEWTERAGECAGVERCFRRAGPTCWER